MSAKNRRLGFLAVLVAVFTVLFIVNRRQKPAAETASLILINGKIVTVEDRFPTASWIALAGDRIAAVGTDAKGFRRHVGDGTRIIDLGGALAVPGLIESHGHFLGLGESLTVLDLTKARTWDDIVALAAEAARATKPGQWIFGRGWHQDKWDRVPVPNVEGLPLHDALSKATPDNPVLLEHASGHSSLANAKAMALSGITAATADPAGGKIVRDAAGRPTGAFLETAAGLIRYEEAGGATPEEEAAKMRRLVELASRECLARGVTTFHDAGSAFATVDLYKKMAAEGALPVRLYVLLNAGSQALAERGPAYRMIGEAGNHLTVRGVKRLIDGALGAHGAWLLEPYDDLPSSTGLNTESIEEMRATARFAIENGFQLATHSIGDRGNRETLDIYEEAFRAHPDKTDLRWRIEHAQHLDAADIPRFAGLGIIPAMQPIHCTSDGPWVPKRIGPARTAAGAYVWRKLMDAGSVIPLGTDVPVERIDPMANFYAAVSRRLKDGTAFYPDQRMTREEALRGYTINGAYAAFETGLKGSLAPGKLADITVLSRDILTCPEEEIPGTEVLYTIVGGRVLYQR
ncbi:MAG TPA: amidohydrolase family protein [Candidatus Aminicenantes bacterium]|nr:amidohydrolase family protein [Candidatus Aminicenantes bacterium]HRY63947.1 amidohydrolase family protein [Candidatus Aminicenantes bacterium]HRZ70860.1 amidohydrolase family protein [Candidatus Aminicenantes bacterium]